MTGRDPILDWAATVLCAADVPRADAEAVVDNLAYAERRGMRSHGLIRLPGYVERIRGGDVEPATKPTVVYEQGGLLVLDAGRGLGAASATAAARLAATRAEHAGIACVIVTRSNHFGAAGHYANLIADRGCFAIVASNTDRIMAPPAGGRRTLGSNPLAMAAPLPRNERPQLDMATSAVSFGKLMVAAQEGDSIPEGWAVGSDGRPTTTTADALDGALLPAAGAKGFGLAYLIDALIALGGAPTSAVADLGSGFGMVFVAIAMPDSTTPADYADALHGLADAVRAGGPPDTPPPLLPGERGTRYEAEHGLELSDSLRAKLEALGTSLGVPFPSAERSTTDD